MPAIYRPFLRTLALGVIALVLAGCVTVGEPGAMREPQEPLNIRIMHGIPSATIIGMMDAKTDILPNYGTEYTLELRRVQGTAEAATALAAGEADLGYSATGVLLNANQNLNANLRILADVVQNGIDGQNANWYVVREDSEIQEVADLRGKTVASLGFGTFIDMAMRVGLVQAGLDPERDVTIVQVNYPAMEANLREGKVDMVQMVPPFYQRARAAGGIRVLFTPVDTVGPVQALFLVGRAEFLEDNPQRVQAFFDDYHRFLQYALDPANRDEMIRIAAEKQDLPPEAFQDYLFTDEDFYRDPNGMPNIEAIRNEMELLHEFGVIDEVVDIEPWVDLSFMERAATN